MFEREYDILVCGAGIAGIAAALEAARNGHRVALVEKTILPGGLATSGLVNIYLPLCDGRGRQVTFGIAEELLQLSIKYGPGDVPDTWRQSQGESNAARYRVAFSPASFILALDEALVAAGVSLWFDTLVCQPLLDNGRITGLEVETKGGRGRLHGQCVIDATGDGDIAARSGAPCVEGSNIMSLWALMASLDSARVAAERHDGTPLLAMYRHGGDAGDPEAPSAAGRDWHGLDAEEISAFALAGRAILREQLVEHMASSGEHTRKQYYPVTLPSMAQYRMTRRIIGRETVLPGQYDVPQATSVGLVADWRVSGQVWEIPYGALMPQQVTGLLAAGRCIASEGDAWHVLRVIPAAALTGQVAGLAASLAVHEQTTPDQVDVQQLQHALHRKGIPYHLQDVGL